jgi:NTP pyrophosphatase (non-canonical NTP hydrolase)
MNIEGLLDQELAKEQAVPRKRSGKFSPSSFGQCYRRQIWNRMDEPKTNEPDARALRIFKIGKMVHEYLQSLIPNTDEVCEKHYEGEDFHGFADHVGEDFVEDFKTVNGFKFKKICNEKTDIASECSDYILQLMAYCLWFDKPVGRLTFINKDDWQIRVFDFKLADYKEKVEDEMDTLMLFWKNRERRLPSALPRLYRGSECRYCNFSVGGKCKG